LIWLDSFEGRLLNFTESYSLVSSPSEFRE
jgi:hypothetical protein